ncbi:MAG: serine hydrolase [Saprospiraceae bacterium]|jgi:D-alanyl-D-alanine carboxypeptidase|nr:serine hydrolase [Saprospiraceae bacterium]
MRDLKNIPVYIIVFRFLIFLFIFCVISCSKEPETEIVNTSPSITINDVYSLRVDEQSKIDIKVSDAENDRLTVSVSGLPASLAFDNNGYVISGKPALKDTGTYKINIVASDSKLMVEKVTYLYVYKNDLHLKNLKLNHKLLLASRSITPGLLGVTIAVVTTDKKLFAGAVGRLSSVSPENSLLPTHSFRIASVTKPMIAAIILKLADEGRLDINGPITKYVENLIPNMATMTVKHLLSHTGGVFDHLNANSFWNHPENKPGKIWTLNELINFSVSGGPVFQPGKGYAYSNTGYVILGKIIENITKMPIEDACKKLLFDPLKLQKTFYDNFSGNSNPLSDLATNNRSYEYSPTAAGPSGAVVSNSIDVAYFGKEIYGSGYLKPASLQDMITNHGVLLAGQNYGYGTRLWDLNGIKHYGHTGALMDYRAIVMYVPSKDMSIAMCTHNVHSAWFDLVNEMLLYCVSEL